MLLGTLTGRRQGRSPALGKGGVVIETLFTSLDGGEQMEVEDKGENNGIDEVELAM